MSEKNTKKLGFYLGIIFVTVIALLFVATLSQISLTPNEALTENENKTTGTLEMSVSALVVENEQLKKDLKEANARIQELESLMIADEKEQASEGRMSENDQFLKTAEEEFENENFDLAREAIMNVNAKILDEESLKTYNRLAKELGL